MKGSNENHCQVNTTTQNNKSCYCNRKKVSECLIQQKNSCANENNDKKHASLPKAFKEQEGLCCCQGYLEKQELLGGKKIQNQSLLKQPNCGNVSASCGAGSGKHRPEPAVCSEPSDTWGHLCCPTIEPVPRPQHLQSPTNPSPASSASLRCFIPKPALVVAVGTAPEVTVCLEEGCVGRVCWTG